MKKLFIIFLGIILVGCGPAPTSQNNSLNEHYITKVIGKAYHGDSKCQGHAILTEKHEFQEDGHDMWMYISCIQDVSSYNSISVIHSPDCKKCYSKKPSVLEESAKSDDYWGW